MKFVCCLPPPPPKKKSWNSSLLSFCFCFFNIVFRVNFSLNVFCSNIYHVYLFSYIFEINFLKQCECFFSVGEHTVLTSSSTHTLELIGGFSSHGWVGGEGLTNFLYALFFSSFFFKVEISSRTPIPPISQHQSTVAEQTKTTGNEHSLMSCL